MNRKINIAIIDSGVKTTHPKFVDDKIKGFTFTREGIVNELNDEYGHGTAVYNIIRKCLDIAEIEIIKLRNIENGISFSLLQSLLDYIGCYKHYDIINMSFGLDTCDNIDDFKSSIKNIADSGTIIISAFSNDGSFSYPAAFEDVIGVVSGDSCKTIGDFEYVEDTIVNIAANGNIQRLAWATPDYLMMGGNSFACAHVTVQVAKFIFEGTETKTEILKRFKEISVKQHFSTKKCPSAVNLFQIKRAVLFPFNKEMHSLIRYNEILQFEIVDVYDVKWSGKVGATTAHLLKNENLKKFIIKNIENIEWNSFDTLILGHIDQLMDLSNDEQLREHIIMTALNHGKKIYSFDDLNNLNLENNPNLFCPRIDKNNLPLNRFGMLYRTATPVVGVFGTSSRQGKFTLQLGIRKTLQNLGYNVGQIGTEPSALLFGMDYVFPMGYNSSVYIHEYDVIHYLNHIINELSLMNKDIIVLGSQSGTILYDGGNINRYPVSQYNFLLGTQPDCVVLCVNPFDDIMYIGRTINFIESSVDSKVIALVVFPMDYNKKWTGIYGYKDKLSDDRYCAIKKELTEHFHINIYRLGDEENILELVNNIVDYFS